MPLSKVALMCLDTNSYLHADLVLDEEMKPKKKPARVHTPQTFMAYYEALRRRPDKFARKLSVSVPIFDYILENIRSDLTLSGSVPLTPENKLYMTLRYLVTGSSIRALSLCFHVAANTAQKVIFSTLQYVWRRLSGIHLREPIPSEMYAMATKFYRRWNFPNCVGAIDGKCLRLAKKGCGIRVAKRKVGQNVLVLNAVVDADFRFVVVDVIGRDNVAADDSFRDIFAKIGMRCLPGADVSVMLPLVIVGNESYPLKSYLMKPYPKRLSYVEPGKALFNERLRRARYPVNVAFEVLADKWQIFSRPLVHHQTDLQRATLLIKVTCLLSNIIIDKDLGADPHFRRFKETHATPLRRNLWRKTRKNNKASKIALSIREQFEKYFLLEQQRKTKTTS